MAATQTPTDRLVGGASRREAHGVRVGGSDKTGVQQPRDFALRENVDSDLEGGAPSLFRNGRGSGLYAGIVTALNLSQISEFSLVILTLGTGYGQVSPQVSAVVLTAMILTSIVSPYVIG